MLYSVTDFSPRALESLGKGFSQNIVIYGCGIHGGQVLDELRGQGVEPLAFCDADAAKWGEKRKSLPVLSPANAGEQYGDSALFIVAIAKYSMDPESVERDISPNLRHNRCRHIGYVPDIHETLARFECRVRDIGINEPVVDLGDFRMPNFFLDDNRHIRECFGFVVMEHFHGAEGREATSNYGRPYDRGDAAGLQKGDVVIDAGANLGIFSAYAAAKGCIVHAFEPVPMLAVCLEKTAALYPGQINVHPEALGDKDDVVEFTASPAALIGNHIMTGPQIQNAVDGTSGQIQVKMVAIDAFIAEKRISRIDFIKADIEGAERLMLRGAAESLLKYAPRMAICSYHLPDDPQVLEAIIRECNPRYHIENLDNMMYAWIQA